MLDFEVSSLLQLLQIFKKKSVYHFYQWLRQNLVFTVPKNSYITPSKWGATYGGSGLDSSTQFVGANGSLVQGQPGHSGLSGPPNVQGETPFQKLEI